MTVHRLSKSKRGGYLVIGPFDQRVVDALKQLPVRARRWDGVIRAWRITDGFGDAAQQILDGIR